MGAGELDAVLAELWEVRRRLEAASGEDAEKIRELEQRRDRLRREARAVEEAADPRGTIARLRHELDGLVRQWEELADKRIDVVKQAGGGGEGGDFGFTSHAMDVNREIDAAGGRSEIEARIARIRARLEDLEA
jgi:hypothetical protein